VAPRLAFSQEVFGAPLRLRFGIGSIPFDEETRAPPNVDFWNHGARSVARANRPAQTIACNQLHAKGSICAATIQCYTLHERWRSKAAEVLGFHGWG